MTMLTETERIAIDQDIYLRQHGSLNGWVDPFVALGYVAADATPDSLLAIACDFFIDVLRLLD